MDSILRYDKIRKVGEGTYGQVFMAFDLRDRCFVALKKFKDNDPGVGISQSTLREVALLKELNRAEHPNIVKLKEMFWLKRSNSLVMVLEWSSCDIDRLLRFYGRLRRPGSQIIPKLPDQLVRKLLYQLISAMATCHSLRILHRDLKPANILIDRNMDAKVCDFGLAKSDESRYQDAGRKLSTDVVTLWYRSPEVLLGNPRYTDAVDVWSIGCIFYELVMLSPLFQGYVKRRIDNPDENRHAWQQAQLYEIFRVLGTPDLDRLAPETRHSGLPNWVPIPGSLRRKLGNRLCRDGKDLIEKMLKLYPEARISCERALEHRYFDELPEMMKKNPDCRVKDSFISMLFGHVKLGKIISREEFIRSGKVFGMWPTHQSDPPKEEKQEPEEEQEPPEEEEEDEGEGDETGSIDDLMCDEEVDFDF